MEKQSFHISVRHIAFAVLFLLSMYCFVLFGCANPNNSNGSNRIYAIEYSTEPTDAGGSITYTLTRKNDNEATMYITQYTGSRYPETKTISIPIEAFDKLGSICDKYGVFNWSEDVIGEETDNSEAADEKRFVIYLEGGEEIAFGSAGNLPENGDKPIGELSRCIEGLAETTTFVS